MKKIYEIMNELNEKIHEFLIFNDIITINFVNIACKYFENHLKVT